MTETNQLGLEPIELTGAADDDLVLWSVTTIIDVLDKSGLKWWAAGMTADAAIDSPKTWQSMLEEEGREAAWKWLRAAHTRRPKNQLKSSDLGTVEHTVCQTYALTGQRPGSDFIEDLIYRKGGEYVDIESETAVIQQMTDQFDKWLQRFTPSYQATEVCVYSPTYGYAGQCDGFATIDDTKFILDYKTSREPYDSQGHPKGPYPEVGLQLAAYRWAEFAAVWRPRRFEKQFRRYYALSPAERELAVAVPDVYSGMCIYITPEACDAYPVRCDEQIHEYFLFCLEVARWVNEVSKTVLGEALT